MEANRARLQAEVEYRRCKADPVYFISHYVYIRHPSKGRILFGSVLSPAQVSAIKAFQEERYNLVLKARQTGFTTVAMAFVLWFALFHGDRQVLVLSRREEDAIKNLARAIYAYNHLPKWLKLRAGDGIREARTNKGVEKMEFLNDSIIDSLPATKQTGRGEASSLTVLDEWAFFPDPEETWAAIEPTADVGGAIIAISTANGVGNAFHDMWMRAQAGDGLFTPLFYDWSALPQRDEAWYKGKAETLEEWQLFQEYPRDAEEAFIRSARTYYDVDLLRTWECPRPYMRYVVEPNGTWSGRMDGELRVWKTKDPDGEPIEHPHPQHTYVIGADTAEGLPHGDFSSAHVIDVQSGDVVGVWHGRIDPGLFGHQVLHSLGEAYNWALIGVERNGSGITTLTALVNANYPNIYFQTYLDRVSQTMQKKFGWVTSRVSRPLMLDELGEAIREHSILIPDEGTRQELLGFVRDDTGKGVGSPHDDRVISCAIAVQMLKWAHTPEYQAPAVKPYTLQWYHERFFKPPPTNLAEVVGNERMRSP